MIFAYFKKAVSVWAVNLLESLGIHFIILISPDNLKSQAILMELGQILFRLLFLYYIAVSQDLKEIKLRENDKIPLHSMRGFRMLGFDFTHFPFFFFQTHLCLFSCKDFIRSLGLENHSGCLFLSESPHTAAKQTRLGSPSPFQWTQIELASPPSCPTRNNVKLGFSDLWSPYV